MSERRYIFQYHYLEANFASSVGSFGQWIASLVMLSLAVGAQGFVPEAATSHGVLKDTFQHFLATSKP